MSSYSDHVSYEHDIKNVYTRSSLVAADSGALLADMASSLALSYSDKSIFRAGCNRGCDFGCD